MMVMRATRGEFDAVMRLLSDARAWHRERGVDVWAEFDPAAISQSIAEGNVYVAKSAGSVRGTVTLLESDVLVWGADEGTALYLHKLASSRLPPREGVGGLLIRWAAAEARRRGKRWLRLDTWNENRGTRSYYERQGFRHVRDEFFAIDSPLPPDYRGTYKSLYQLDL
jgi:GNAT superfamily N-acetyltransferase